jgi:hypothetical protein
MTAPRPVRPAALFDDAGVPIALGQRLSDSGEASVFRLDGDSGLLVKLHRDPGPALRAKLAALPALAPDDPSLDPAHRNFAWPAAAVRDACGEAVGCLIPAVPNARSLTALASPKLRVRRAAGLDWLSLHGIAAHLAFAVGCLHDQGFVIGDLAPENVLIDDRARVTLIDCDSMQAGEYLCPVGSEGYTAPEWIGRRFDAGPREETADRFALAVLIHQLLTGAHPWTGEWMGPGDPPPRDRLIRAGEWPFRAGAQLRPVPGLVAPEMLGPDLDALFRRAFIAGIRDPAARPNAAEWQEAVCLALSALEPCARRPHHHFDPALGACPWCARTDAGLPDPFPASAAVPDPFAPLILALRRALARGDAEMAAALWRTSPALAGRRDLGDLATVLAALPSAQEPAEEPESAAPAFRAEAPRAPAARAAVRLSYRIEPGWPGLRAPSLRLQGREGTALPPLQLIAERDGAVLLQLPAGRLRRDAALSFEAPECGGPVRLRLAQDGAVDIDHPPKRERLPAMRA